MRKPTIVMLECNPYPEMKPEHDGVYYLVQYDQYSRRKGRRISTCIWGSDDWITDGAAVIAWAEMPESLSD